MGVCSSSTFVLWNKLRKRILTKWRHIGWSNEYITLNAMSYITGNRSPALFCLFQGWLTCRPHQSASPSDRESMISLGDRQGSSSHLDIVEVGALGILQTDRWDGFYPISENVSDLFWVAFLIWMSEKRSAISGLHQRNVWVKSGSYYYF